MQPQKTDPHAPHRDAAATHGPRELDRAAQTMTDPSRLHRASM